MKRIVIILIGLLVLSNTFWIYEIKEDNKFINTLSNSITTLSTHLHELDLLKEARIYEFNINGREASLKCELLDSHGKTYRLRDILNGNKLILRYTDLNCHTCIEEQIKNLETYIDSIRIKNIAVIVSSDNPIYLNSFKKINKIKFPIYNISKEQNKYFEDIGLPYFFILTLKGKMTNTFVPYKEMPEFTNNYLHSIYNQYFLNN